MSISSPSNPLRLQVASILMLTGGCFLLYALIPILRETLHKVFLGIGPVLLITSVHFALRKWHTYTREWKDILLQMLLLGATVATLLHFESSLWQWGICSVLGVGSAIGVWHYRITCFLFFCLCLLVSPFLFWSRTLFLNLRPLSFHIVRFFLFHW